VLENAQTAFLKTLASIDRIGYLNRSSNPILNTKPNNGARHHCWCQ